MCLSDPSVDVCFLQVLFVSKTHFMTLITARRCRSIRCKLTYGLRTEIVWDLQKHSIEERQFYGTCT